MEEDGGYGKDLGPEDMIADEDGMYESEEENIDIKQKEKPVGPPLVLEIPLRPPPARPEKVCFPCICWAEPPVHGMEYVFAILQRPGESIWRDKNGDLFTAECDRNKN